MNPKQRQEQDQQRQDQQRQGMPRQPGQPGEDPARDIQRDERFPEATEGQQETGPGQRPRDTSQSDSSRNEGNRNRSGQGDQSRG